MNNLTRSLDWFEPSSLLALRQGLETEKLRRAAKTSLISFTEFTYPRYEAAAIHKHIAEQLERVERGEIDRLMLLVPLSTVSRTWPLVVFGLVSRPASRAAIHQRIGFRHAC